MKVFSYRSPYPNYIFKSNKKFLPVNILDCDFFNNCFSCCPYFLTKNEVGVRCSLNNYVIHDGSKWVYKCGLKPPLCTKEYRK